MKVWFDTIPTQQIVSYGSECQDDCDNDCPVTEEYPSFIFHSITKEDVQNIRTQVLQQISSLYFQECQDQRWLICDPVGTGRVVVVDEDAFALLEHFHTQTTLHQVIPKISMCSLVSIEKLVAVFYKLGFLQGTRRSSPIHEWNEPETLTAWLHVTNACNLRCHYCYLDKTSEHMADDTAYRSIDAIFRSARMHDFQGVKLKYAGGEASLHLSNIVKIHDYAVEEAKKYGIAFNAHIHSNGVVLSQQSIEQLKSRHIGVTISLDGVGTYHDSQRPFINGQGSFKYVDRTITRLLASNVTPHITVTVSQRNLDGLLDLMRYILERDMSFTLSYYRDNECTTNITDLQFSEAQMIAKMQDVYTLIEQNLPRRQLLNSLIDKANLASAHRYTCGVGRNYLVIDQDGGVAKCQADIKRRVTTINARDPLQMIRDDRNGVQGLSVEDKEGCRTCEWRYWCGGGCPLLTHRITGRYDIKSPNCHIYKALFPEALRLEALRLLKYESPLAL